ncbi:MAG: sulfite exporter TauE/SafE family protein [Deltaproteobacteria bacterium]|nr:sulfite exporter TauE/SafE family protein [Deltaproteobacteria bacterium]
MNLSLWLFFFTGLFAEFIDGSLGMGYGVISSSLLIAAGLTPVLSSATVHLSEIFVSAASGISHLRFGNVEKRLLITLLIPGSIGALTGAFILLNLPSQQIKPFVSIYLLIMGMIILYRSFGRISSPRAEYKAGILALFGGFFDAIGGGGWGPIVTSTLLSRGYEPSKIIGTVNLAEFFITVVQGGVFALFVNELDFRIVLMLILGGTLAAPLAAYFCKKIPSKKLMILSGLLVIILSLRNIYLFAMK